jgi:hypothetical protein
MERVLLCTYAEPCPDDRTGSIQYQDKEDRRKVNTDQERIGDRDLVTDFPLTLKKQVSPIFKKMKFLHQQHKGSVI